MSTNKPPQSKWDKIKKESEVTNAPVTTEARIRQLYLNTQLGSPADTPEEVDAQRHNLGPKDTAMESAEDSEELDSSRRPGVR